jgi:hypothetical protein
MTTIGDAYPGHSIALQLSAGDDVKATFACSAGLDSRCHEACEHEHCEEGCVCVSEGRQPQLMAFDECLIKTWMDNEGGYWWEAYDGPDVEPHSGPILVWWSSTDETWLWKYAEPGR